MVSQVSRVCWRSDVKSETLMTAYVISTARLPIEVIPSERSTFFCSFFSLLAQRNGVFGCLWRLENQEVVEGFLCFFFSTKLTCVHYIASFLILSYSSFKQFLSPFFYEFHHGYKVLPIAAIVKLRWVKIVQTPTVYLILPISAAHHLYNLGEIDTFTLQCVIWCRIQGSCKSLSLPLRSWNIHLKKHRLNQKSSCQRVPTISTQYFACFFVTRYNHIN